MITLIGRAECYTLEIALAGVNGTSPNPWGSTPAQFSSYDTRLELYMHRLINGGTVIDKRMAFARDADACIKGVMSGPMLNPLLPKGIVDRCYLGHMDLNEAGTLRSLDYVALDIYCDLWRDLGARIGTRVNNTIIWDDGTIDPISEGI